MQNLSAGGCHRALIPRLPVEQKLRELAAVAGRPGL
jgi:hypothetical protein